MMNGSASGGAPGHGDGPARAAIRVMIVDDHAMVRSGLSAFLLAFDDLELAAEASSGEEAVRICGEGGIDVVLMDLVMPGMDGATATRAIREACGHVQVVALTSFPEEDLVKGALEAGAIGYLLKNVTAVELADAIRAAAAGRPTLAPEATSALIHSATAGPAVGSDLTDREREVLALMAEGLANSQIAAKLFVSDSTVKFHVSSVLRKLDAASRTEAVSIAMRERLV
jgi:NarL family two-component system response regulator LiaR